jgi:hypothetical protein
MPARRHTTGVLRLALIDVSDLGSMAAIDPAASVMLDMLNRWASSLDAAISSGSLSSIVVVATTGNIDGSNATFTLVAKPPSGLLLFKNGILQHGGSTEDYVYDGNLTITFDVGNIPQINDTLIVIGY